MTTTTTRQHAAEATASALARLRRLGFLEGVPAWIRPETAAIDARIAKRCRCKQCQSKCAYLPLGRPADRRYRVLAVCPACSAVSEEL